VPERPERLRCSSFQRQVVSSFWAVLLLPSLGTGGQQTTNCRRSRAHDPQDLTHHRQSRCSTRFRRPRVCPKLARRKPGCATEDSAHAPHRWAATDLASRQSPHVLRTPAQLPERGLSGPSRMSRRTSSKRRTAQTTSQLGLQRRLVCSPPSDQIRPTARREACLSPSIR
jgi:hypothetical protein